MLFIKRYWIAGLVLLLVVIHAMIIGYVRSEAARLKSVSSSEIPIGLYYVQSEDRQWLTQLRIHLAVPLERRLVAKATIEHNRWLVHEAVEEALRQLDRSLLTDASLLKVKETVKKVIDETLHEAVVEQVVISDRFDLPVDHFRLRIPQDLTAPSESLEPVDAATKLTSSRQQRKTASEQTVLPDSHGQHGGDGHGGHADAGHGEAAHGDSGHGSGHGDSGHGDGGHGSDAHGGASADSHAPAAGHGGGHH